MENCDAGETGIRMNTCVSIEEGVVDWELLVIISVKEQGRRRHGDGSIITLVSDLLVMWRLEPLISGYCETRKHFHADGS